MGAEVHKMTGLMLSQEEEEGGFGKRLSLHSEKGRVSWLEVLWTRRRWERGKRLRGFWPQQPGLGCRSGQLEDCRASVGRPGSGCQRSTPGPSHRVPSVENVPPAPGQVRWAETGLAVFRSPTEQAALPGVS